MKTSIIALILIIFFTSNMANADNFMGLFGDITVQDVEHESLDHDAISGTLDLYLVHTFNDRFSTLLEYVYDNTPSHKESHVERLSIKYSFDPKFNIAIGRFHTPLGNLNRTQHHGTLLQDTVNRPFFLSFHDDTSILPLHVVGFMADGLFRHKQINIGYEVTLHSSQSLDVKNHHQEPYVDIDPNNDLSGSIDPGFSGRLRLFPDNRRWQYGVFFLTHDTENEDPLTNEQFEQTIAGLDVLFSFDNWTLVTEYFHIRNSDLLTDSDFASNALFMEATYSLREDLKLIYRYETININSNDSYYNIFSLSDQDRHQAAIRYDINDNHALKLQVETIDYRAGITEDTHAVYAQWSFLIN